MNQENNHDKIMYMLGEIRGDIKGILTEAQKTNGSIKDLYQISRKNENDITAIKTKTTIFGGIAGLVISLIWTFLKDSWRK